MQQFSLSPLSMVISIWKNRSLISVLIRRDIMSRYSGSFVGILWAGINPLLMLAVYTFVFSFVFKARWPGGSDSKTEFALMLFSGLTVFNLFAECVSRAPTIILSNINFVKKIIFPLEVLPIVIVSTALFHFLISFVVLLTAFVFVFGLPGVTILIFPLVLVPVFFLGLGVSWVLASIGVFFRDISQFVGLFITVLMFLSPIFYSSQALPEKYRILLNFNPLTPTIEQTRDVLFWGKAPDMLALTVQILASALFLWLGFAWFQKTRKGFADVL